MTGEDVFGRPLPAEIVAPRGAPRRAVIGLIAGQEIEKQARLVERPPAAVLPLEDFAEALLRAAAAEEMRLIGSPLIGVTRRDGDAINPHLGHRVEEARDPLRLGGVEQGRVDVDAKPALFGEADRLDRTVVDAGLTA